jgi:hypothetical protein
MDVTRNLEERADNNFDQKPKNEQATWTTEAFPIFFVVSFYPLFSF